MDAEKESIQSPRIDYVFMCSLFYLACLTVILTHEIVGLQSAAENCIQVDFVAIPDSGNSCSMTEMEWADFATGLADYENASASYCPCGEQVCSLAAMHTATGLPKSLFQASWHYEHTCLSIPKQATVCCNV